MNKLKEEFKNKIIKELKKELNKKSFLAVPTLDKIIVNVGLGEAVNNPQVIEKVGEDISLITGQKPLVTKAKQAISNFKIRVGLPIGLKVTLRKNRMWDFYEKLVKIVLPRVKDFRGVSRNSFDGYGNYCLGIGDYSIFSEIDPNRIDKIRSLEIIIVTTSESNDEGRRLLGKLGMPFSKEKDLMFFDKMAESIKKEEKERKKLKAQRMAEGKEIEERRVE